MFHEQNYFIISDCMKIYKCSLASISCICSIYNVSNSISENSGRKFCERKLAKPEMYMKKKDVYPSKIFPVAIYIQPCHEKQSQPVCVPHSVSIC